MRTDILGKLFRPFAPLDPVVQQELCALGYENLRVHCFGNTALSSIIIWAVWHVAPDWGVYAWGALMVLVTLMFLAGMWLLRDRLKVRPLSESTLRIWRWSSLLMLTMPGIGWGSTGMLLVEDAHINNLMIMTSFAGALSYSAVSNAHDLRGFIVGASAGTLILCLNFPRVFGEHAAQMAAMTILYLGVLTTVAYHSHQTLLETIRLRLSNEYLARSNAEQAARAEQANRDKSEFLAAASHDLRQPVHALLLLIEAYRQQSPSQAQHPLLSSIATAGQSISSLFNGLMELSRLEGGRDKPRLAPCDLTEVLDTVIQRVLPQAQQKGLQFRLLVSKRVQTLQGQGFIMTDRVMLERILGNLLTNAVRYTHRGGIALTLRPHKTTDASSREAAAHGLALDVWDTGIGVAPSDQQRIFSPYVQVANKERDRTQGLGLGLSIVKQALSLLGWPLSLTSQPGRGSRFRLLIPSSQLCDAPSRLAELPHKAMASTSQAAAVLAGKRMLLIDDDLMVLQAMQTLLGGWGTDCRVATHGSREVLKQCDEHWQPDCILCDFRLPGELNGIEVLDLLQDHCPNAAGILLTGELAQTVQAQAEEAGYMVLSKPVDPNLLALTLNTLLAHRQQHSQPA